MRYRLNEAIVAIVGSTATGMRIVSLPRGAALTIEGGISGERPDHLVAGLYHGETVRIYERDIVEHATALKQ